MVDIMELPVVVQALMLAAFLFGMLVGVAITAGAIAHKMGGRL